jgi:hypothetical protein
MERQEFIQEMQPSDAVLQAAKQNPGGWVYQIDRKYAASQSVPPEAIVGAWRVNQSGSIVGDFIPNPNYTPEMKDKDV